MDVDKVSASRGTGRVSGLVAAAIGLALATAGCGGSAGREASGGHDARPVAAQSSQAPALPRPTGPHAVGRQTLRLVDDHRKDPWVPSAGKRQLMVSMYYPAQPGTGGPATYMTTEEARLFLEGKAPGAGYPPTALSATRTWAHEDARPEDGRFPLVVLSPGMTLQRSSLTGLAEDLTSRGYVVALVDHTYENYGTTFPDGRTLACVICDKPPAGGLPAIARSRAVDVSFVLDQLVGPHPAWADAAMIDPARIGMAGHSIGGNSTSTTMAHDHRVLAGVNMDGTFFQPVSPNGLNHRPFLMLAAEHAPPVDRTWTTAWKRLNGWKRWLTVAKSDHGTFTDLPVLYEWAGRPGPGITAARSEAVTRTYVGAFFDRSLKGLPQPVLDGPTPANPDVTFHNP